MVCLMGEIDMDFCIQIQNIFIENFEKKFDAIYTKGKFEYHK